METTTYVTTTTPVDSGAAAAFFAVYMIFVTVIAVVAIVAMWKIFSKAGKPGWAAIVPFYNIYVMLEVVGRPGWWLLLYFVPVANVIVSIIVAVDLAKSFGKSEMFGVIGLWLFSIIGYLMLGFGKATYNGPSVTPAAPTAPAAV